MIFEGAKEPLMMRARTSENERINKSTRCLTENLWSQSGKSQGERMIMCILCTGTNTSSNHERSVVSQYKIDVNKCIMHALCSYKRRRKCKNLKQWMPVGNEKFHVNGNTKFFHLKEKILYLHINGTTYLRLSRCDIKIPISM